MRVAVVAVKPAIALTRAIVAAALWCAPVGAADAQSVQVDLELLLAIDASSSVSDGKFALQVEGLAAAFRDTGVRSAIRSAGRRGIAVAIVQWAGPFDQRIALDWTRLAATAEIDDFADQISIMPRHFAGGDTRIGRAIEFSTALLIRNGYHSRRQVIDISGDGGAEKIGFTRLARDLAVAQGIVINGLAIENEVLDLRIFFRDNVISGPGAFAMRAGNYNDFAVAMRRKLTREINNRTTAALSSNTPSL